MLDQLIQDLKARPGLPRLREAPELDRSRPAGVAGALPAGLVFTERAAGILRQFLCREGRGHYRVFQCWNLDLDDIEAYLGSIGEPADWEPLDATTLGGASISRLTHDGTRAWMWDGGALRIAGQEVVLGRWFWWDNHYQMLTLAAAPSTEAYLRLRQALLDFRRRQAKPIWQVITGDSSRDGTSIPRTLEERDGLILSDALRKRIETEIAPFFTPAVKELYARLRVPYRRGVLLHGPPGNGKTSLIRVIGASALSARAFLLSPDAQFDVDDLRQVISRWIAEAPSILAIEDLDWLLGKVNVSTFLNLLDGVGWPGCNGLLLIATTNHPEKLDPAINNRPGRFDVVIEVPPPDEPQRETFLRRGLPEATEETLRSVVRRTRGLSFAHLQEILRLSGMLAIHASRSERSEADILEAAELVLGASEGAERGFAAPPEMPFGLGALHEEARRSRQPEK